MPAPNRQLHPRERPDWDDYFIGVAQAVSRRAECVRRKVGAIIVDSERRIIACGYNGVPAGEASCLLGACPGYSSVVPCISIHAEANAIAHADIWSLCGSTMYVTDEPCAKCISIAHGVAIRELVFPDWTPAPTPLPRSRPEWEACRKR